MDQGIVLYSIVFKHLYSASHSIKPYRSAFYCNYKYLLENRQVLRRAKEVDKLEERMIL